MIDHFFFNFNQWLFVLNHLFQSESTLRGDNKMTGTRASLTKQGIRGIEGVKGSPHYMMSVCQKWIWGSRFTRVDVIVEKICLPRVKVNEQFCTVLIKCSV
jgi:hypothetical protein